MNWYQQQKSAINWKEVGKGFGTGVLMGTLPFAQDTPSKPVQSPSAIVAPAEPESQPTSQPATQPTTKPSTQPAMQSAGPINIDVKKIIQMESSGRSDAVSPVGAAGLMQVMPATWEDIASKIGKYRGFEKYKFDEAANISIGSHYMNQEIPRMLRAFNIPDSVDTRLASYNWGIGNVRRVYREHGAEWKNFIPKETSDYLKKYRR